MKSKILYILFLFFTCAIAFSQEMRIVSGVIKDNNGEPLIGVSVHKKGSEKGTFTNMDGYYEIEVPLGSILQFRYIGMKTSEMKVTEANSKPAAKWKSDALSAQEAPKPEKEDVVEPKVESKENGKVRPPVITPSREGQSLSPYFLITGYASTDAHLPLKNTDVTVNIAGVIADVCVKQIYINEGKETLEAVYVFPGSTRAAVYGMSMTIGDRRVEAKIKKKEQARQEYEQAKQEGKSTTLLEQHRPNVFQMNVANIQPGDTIVVEMLYTELLEHESGVYEFVYPTLVGPRYSNSGEEWVDQSIAQLGSEYMPQFSIRTTIQAGMPIRKISSVSHNLAIESPTPDQAIVSLSNPKDYEGDRDYILQYELQGGKVESGLLLYEHGDENFFLLMMQPPKKPTLDQIPPREYVFIVDVSGSMYGFPISVSKELIRNLVSGLRPTDRFNVMLFESSNAMLYKESVPATERNIEKALAVIDKQKGSGGTEMYPAIKNAMSFKETEGFSRTFIIITDGFVSVEKEAFNYIRSNLNTANLFPFGIGNNVNRYLIEGLAHAGMGTPYIVTNLSQAEEIGKKVIREISEPVLTKISIDWDEFEAYDVEPVAIPDVFAERPILVYGKYKTPAKGSITVSGIAGDATYKQSFNVMDARKENNQALRYLWARNQIRYYDDFAQYYEGNNNFWSDSYGNHQRSEKQIEYVTNLGLKYNLLTQYTSFLAVDEVVRTPNLAAGDRSNGHQTPMPVTPSDPQSISAPDFQLTEDASLLEEVIVVGYGTQRKAELTGSVSTISSSEISSGTGVLSLEGKAAGLQVTQTAGEPNAESRIRVRGSGSIMDNSSPLIIVDGVPVEYSSLQQMNPNDIESITVLKDASSTALYGSRAANGVLIISSKSPQYKKLSVAWSSSFSVETPNKLPKMQKQFAQGRQENGIPVWRPENEPFSWGPDAQATGAPTYDAYDFLRLGHTFKNHLTLSGRYRKSQYSVRLGNHTQQGFFPQSRFSENSMGVKLGHERNSKLRYDFEMSYKNMRGNRLQRGYNKSNIMQGILLTPPTFDNRVSTNPDGSQRTAGNATDNPYWMVKNNPFNDEAHRLSGSLNLNYKLIDYLTLQYQLSGEYLLNNAHTAMNIGSVSMPTGHVMEREELFRSLYSRFFIKLDKSFEDLYVNATAGHEYANTGRNIDRTDGYHLQQAGNYAIAHADSIAPYKQSFFRYSHAAFGKASLDFRRKYMLEAAARGEWSSIHSRMLFSPSVGAAVNISELLSTRFFDLIKVYANVSHADKESPLYLDPVYFNSAIYNLNDASHHFESREVLLNGLKPERIRHYEVGTNINFWENRISFSAAWYRKEGKDQVLPIQVSTAAVQLENSGSFQTNGLELELSAYLMRNHDFSWHTRLIFSRERNKVLSLGGRKLMLAGIEGVAGSYALEGKQLGVIMGTTYQRNEQGDMLIGADGFPLVDPELKVIGDPNPDWRLSWNHSLSYRKFTLSFTLDYKKGGDMWNGTGNMMNYYGTSAYTARHRNTTGYVFSGVLPNGQVNNIPVNFYGNNLSENRWVRYGQYGVGEDAIQDASFLKLREISLGYYVPVRLFDKRTHLKMSIYATNLLLFSKYKGVDPETNLTGASNGLGLDYFNIPGVQSLGLSLNWEF